MTNNKKCFPKENRNCWSYMPPGSRVDKYVVHSHIHTKPVFFAREKGTGKEVVLKRAEPVYKTHLSEDPHRLGRIFIQYEAGLQRRAQHPNICPLEGLVENKGRHYLVIPDVGPKNLFHYILSSNPPAHERLMILEDIANALAHCHDRSICHLDVKERNVIVKDKKGILIDFGGAREYGMRHDIVDEFVVATENCGAPEYLDHSAFTPRSDTFSFAYMAFWTLTEKQPYKPYDPKNEPRYSVPLFNPQSLAAYDGFGELVVQGLNKNPGKRPDIKELADAAKEHTSRYRLQHDELTSALCPASTQQAQNQKTKTVQHTKASYVAGRQPQPAPLS
jgi:serine/threonine protein kinase